MQGPVSCTGGMVTPPNLVSAQLLGNNATRQDFSFLSQLCLLTSSILDLNSQRSHVLLDTNHQSSHITSQPLFSEKAGDRALEPMAASIQQLLGASTFTVLKRRKCRCIRNVAMSRSNCVPVQ